MPTSEEGSPSGEPQSPPAPSASPPADFQLPKTPQGAPPPPPPQYLPPQPPPAARADSEEPLPDVRPARFWYWVGGAVFPVNLLISILLLSDNPEASPALIVGGILTPMLTFVVSLVICVTVLVMRTSRLSRQRVERAQRAHGAGAVPAYPGRPAFTGGPGYAPPLPPIEIPSKDVRPRRRWLVVGALAWPTAFAVGATVFGVIAVSASDASPDFASQTLRGSGTLEFEVTEDQVDSLGLYSTAEPDEGELFHCDLSGPGYPRLTEKVVGYSHEEWRLVESLALGAPGEYELECTGPASLEYAVADTSVAVEYDRSMFLGFGTMMLSTVLGFFLSVVLLVTVGIRRGNHRGRLLSEYRARAYRDLAARQAQNLPHHYPTAPSAPPR
ncbi:hypothetical protein [Nocardiopsis ganjiahuensis]|uniref:hypothetical protein n=1 Tax=Nocardiopsis ganjiahuensis TaxID=239984 RepID=UPI001EF9D24F|nr:hypothetical protein [Nocardiopsis ganjiahuensis]